MAWEDGGITSAHIQHSTVSTWNPMQIISPPIMGSTGTLLTKMTS